MVANRSDQTPRIGNPMSSPLAPLSFLSGRPLGNRAVYARRTGPRKAAENDPLQLDQSVRHARRLKHDKVIRDLAATQKMVMARRQLNEAGIDHQAISRRVHSGALEELTPRVLRIGGAPGSTEQRLMVALLHVGPETFLSHSTAAAWWGIAGLRVDRIHVALERVYRADTESRYVVHHSTVIPEWCRKVHKGIPVVSPGLAIYQLAGTMSEERTARALDSAWSLRLLDGATIDALLRRLGRPGRDGTTLMRRLRRQRPNSWVPPASNLESRFDEIMAPTGMVFRRQVNVGDEEWSGRVDFLADDLPLIVEILSERYHTSLTDRAFDEARRARHTSMGFLVVEVWDQEIFYSPWLVVERIRAARAQLLAFPRLDRSKNERST